VKITIKNLQKKIPIRPKGITQAVLKVFSLEGTRRRGEITVIFVNDKLIRKINLKFLKRNSATDVIAFDISDNKKQFLADIVISTDTAVRNARIFKTWVYHELYLYVIHGVLHILGYDDKSPRQRKIMQRKANQVLSKLNITKH
jgi:probable rRNA maturation factor